jgi:hypothetical protein
MSLIGFKKRFLSLKLLMLLINRSTQQNVRVEVIARAVLHA